MNNVNKEKRVVFFQEGSWKVNTDVPHEFNDSENRLREALERVTHRNETVSRPSLRLTVSAPHHTHKKEKRN